MIVPQAGWHVKRIFRFFEFNPLIPSIFAGFQADKPGFLARHFIFPVWAAAFSALLYIIYREKQATSFVHCRQAAAGALSLCGDPARFPSNKKSRRRFRCRGFSSWTLYESRFSARISKKLGL